MSCILPKNKEELSQEIASLKSLDCIANVSLTLKDIYIYYEINTGYNNNILKVTFNKKIKNDKSFGFIITNNTFTDPKYNNKKTLNVTASTDAFIKSFIWKEEGVFLKDFFDM